jgi:hypothetical protein
MAVRIAAQFDISAALEAIGCTTMRNALNFGKLI